MTADNLGKYLNLRVKFPEMIFENYYLKVDHNNIFYGYDSAA